MCEECKIAFGGIADREVRCRASGCKNTWTWARGDQLDACLAGKPAPKAPHRMCERCLDIYSTSRTSSGPAAAPAASAPGLDKRGAQLARAVRGKTGEPYPHYCENCEKELGELDDRQIACKTDHCTGTWTWTRRQQLAAGVRPEPKERAGSPRPGRVAESGRDRRAAGAPTAAGATAEAAARTAPARRASAGTDGAARPGKAKQRGEPQAPRDPPARAALRDCIEFLEDRKTHEIPCQGCETAIYWPPESQLQTHLGNWSGRPCAAPASATSPRRSAWPSARRCATRRSSRRRGAGEAPSGEAPSIRSAFDRAPPAVEAPAGEARPHQDAAARGTARAPRRDDTRFVGLVAGAATRDSPHEARRHLALWNENAYGPSLGTNSASSDLSAPGQTASSPDDARHGVRERDVGSSRTVAA